MGVLVSYLSSVANGLVCRTDWGCVGPSEGLASSSSGCFRTPLLCSISPSSGNVKVLRGRLKAGCGPGGSLLLCKWSRQVAVHCYRAGWGWVGFRVELELGGYTYHSSSPLTVLTSYKGRGQPLDNGEGLVFFPYLDKG